MVIAALLAAGLFTQEAGPPLIRPATPDAAEALDAFMNLGVYLGTCTAHLPPGAKARLDSMTADQAPPGVPAWLISGFKQGYEKGIADPTRGQRTAAECREMGEAATSRMQATGERLRQRDQ